MESFYQQWLKKNNDENRLAQKELNEPNSQSKKQTNVLNVQPSTSTSRDMDYDPIPSTSSAILPGRLNTQPSDIVYEKDGLQLLVQMGKFQRQKKFSLQAKAFTIKRS